MKPKTIRLTATLAAVLLFAIAGPGYAGEVKFGLHGGLSIPDIRGSQSDIYSRNFTSRQGPFFGLFMETEIAPRWSLVAEVNYTSQGGLRKGLQPITMDLPAGLPVPPGTLLFADFRNETILDYIEVPVMARLTFGNRIHFFVNAGPYVGILVRAKAVTEGSSAIYLDESGTMPIIIPPDTNPMIVDFGATTDVKDSLRSTNIGLAMGGGVKYPVGRGELVLEAHFQLGLSTIQWDIETSGKSQTGAVVISLGYAFPLAKGQ
jgi:hypothetical protein